MLERKHSRVSSHVQDSLSFLSSDFPAAAGVALGNSGELDAEGGEAGFSASPEPKPARGLWNHQHKLQIVMNEKHT